METALNLRPSQVAIVIGVDHKIQHFIPGVAPSDPRTQLRLRLHAFLGEITGGYPVDVICEETQHGLVSIAEALAKKEGIRYVNIEMPPERRDQLGIPRLYTIDPESEIPPEQKAHWNDQREAHMVYELLRAMPSGTSGDCHLRRASHASDDPNTSYQVRPCRAVRCDGDAVVRQIVVVNHQKKHL